MEPMRLMIHEIRRASKEGLLVARVRAVSRERVSGAPRALIRMKIRLLDPGPAVGTEELKHLARDEALRFLDIA
jgi:hypothetical protein